MDDSLLTSSTPNRRTGGGRGRRGLESSDQNEYRALEKRRMSQGLRYDDSNTARCPLAKEGSNGRILRGNFPLILPPTLPQHRRTNSGTSILDTCSDSNCTNTISTPSPESVDKIVLLRHPIKQETVVNGSVVNESQDMEASHGSNYEPAGITGELPEPAISTPQPKSTDASTRKSRASSDDTPPGITAFKALSKNDEIQLYTLQQRIRRRREVIWGLRSRVQEQRGILRAKQYAKAAADDNYMRLVRLRESTADPNSNYITSEGETLQGLFQECEQARAEYGPLEDDCNALEDQLGSEEYELTRLEENFMRICNLIIPHHSRSPSLEIGLEGRSDRSYSEVYQKYHPMVEEYLSKLGDIDIFRERHERHLEEKEALERERETRQRVKLTLTPEDEAWLEQSDELENEILKDLHGARAEAEQLRKKCQAAGLLDENGEPKDFQTQEQEAFAGDVDAKGQKSEYVKFPTLLPQPGTSDTKFKASAPKPEEQSENAGDHINQWLLHSLRSSPLDVNLLARTFEAEVGDFEAQKWQLDVRHHWYRDGSIKDASGYRVYSITSDTPVTSRSKLTKESVPEHIYEPVLGITGRKNAMSDTSSVSGSECLDGQNEIVVGALPRSKYVGNGS
jgi:hypothetical protein